MPDGITEELKKVKTHHKSYNRACIVERHPLVGVGQIDKLVQSEPRIFLCVTSVYCISLITF